MMDGEGDEVVLSRLVHVTSGKEAGLACRICRNFCYDKYKQKCLHAIAIMVDVNETADPHLNIEKLSVGIAKLPLSDGINYISWCVRTSECLKFVKSPEERHFFLHTGWTVVYVSKKLFSGWPRSISCLRRQVDERFWNFPTLDYVYFEKTFQKPHCIRRIILLSKPNCPPSLAMLAKMALLMRYTKGKQGLRYLPCLFKVNPRKIPPCVALNQVSLIRLSRHINDPSFEDPLERTEEEMALVFFLMNL